MSTARRLWVVGVLVVLAWPLPARADRAVARALVEEGLDLRRAGDETGALERFERAIDNDSDYLPAYENAAWLWMGQGRFKAAIAHFERVTLRHPDYAFGWYALAYAYRKTRRFELAVMCYETYIALRPKEADPYFGLAMAHKGQGDTAAAGVALQRYLTMESRPERASFIERARAELEQLGIEPPPPDATAGGDLLGAARELIADQRFASARILLAQVAPETARQRAVLWNLRALAHLGAGDAELAVSAGLVALASSPDDREVCATLARAYRELDQDQSADYFTALAAGATPTAAGSRAPRPADR